MPTKERWAKMPVEEKQKYADHAREWKRANKDKWNAYQRSYVGTDTYKHKKRIRAETRHKRIKHVAFKDELTELVHEEAIHLRKLREQSFGFKWHVDHIIPLNGATVSGLHIWSNIQVIPAVQNLSKGNKEMAKYLT